MHTKLAESARRSIRLMTVEVSTVAIRSPRKHSIWNFDRRQ
ncbi:hypothetical protein RBSWK_00529 [Rhodopirellula baltica SWK14]|uniref:Uncharacterized protein n=1 Tax=Rhodopirellula baltica SWK14 TaxID=993516 RepID=L7CR25_RHOBT|nr:hypothetical protein RBSWK_00529 [Rhodopirellula baltica SWK14]